METFKDEPANQKTVQKKMDFICAELNQAATMSEPVFLGIGQTLQDLWQTSSEVAQTGKAATDLLAGVDLSQTIDRLISTADWLGTLMESSGHRLEQSVDTLKKLLDSMRLASRPLNGLAKTVAGLRMLGISTRIESARISHSDKSFGFLADEVNKQSEGIDAQSAFILEKIEDLSKDVPEILKQIQMGSSGQRTKAQDIVAKLQSGLALLVEKQNASAKSARDISRQSEQISKNIGELVMAIQFHDITRQQMEHVGSALQELKTRDPDEAWARICALQAAQLNHSKKEFCTAVSDIKSNLGRIVASIQTMLAEMQELSGVQRDQCTPFAAALQKDLGSALDSFSQYQGTEQMLQQTLDSFADTLKTMSNFSKDIEMIGYSIKLVALNATIKATRLGRNGAALDVVAQGIRQLSEEAREQTQAVTRALREIHESAGGLMESTSTEDTDDDSRLDDMSRKLAVLFDSVTQSCDGSVGMLERMNRVGRDLAGKIDAANDEIEIHQTLEDRLNPCIALLEELAAAHGGNRVLEGGADMAGLASLYTMESERLVHQKLLEESTRESRSHDGTADYLPSTEPDDSIELFDEPQTEEEAEKDDDLDDNIELF